jgi:hypothetical protein
MRLVPNPMPRGGRRGGGLVLRISVTKAADPANGGQALFKSCEPAIRAAATAAAGVIRTPRIILGLDGLSDPGHSNENSQHEQQKPHSRLLALQ